MPINIEVLSFSSKSKISILSLNLLESVSNPDLAIIDVKFSESHDWRDWLGRAIIIRWNINNNDPAKYFHGFVTKVDYFFLEKIVCYLRSQIFYMTQYFSCRIFSSDHKIFEVLKCLFENASVSYRIKSQKIDNFLSKTFIQYNQSDFNFLHYFLHSNELFFKIEHTLDGVVVLILDICIFEEIGGCSTISPISFDVFYSENCVELHGILSSIDFSIFSKIEFLIGDSTFKFNVYDAQLNINFIEGTDFFKFKSSTKGFYDKNFEHEFTLLGTTLGIVSKGKNYENFKKESDPLTVKIPWNRTGFNSALNKDLKIILLVKNFGETGFSYWKPREGDCVVLAVDAGGNIFALASFYQNDFIFHSKKSFFRPGFMEGLWDEAVGSGWIQEIGPSSKVSLESGGSFNEDSRRDFFLEVENSVFSTVRENIDWIFCSDSLSLTGYKEVSFFCEGNEVIKMTPEKIYIQIDLVSFYLPQVNGKHLVGAGHLHACPRSTMSMPHSTSSWLEGSPSVHFSGFPVVRQDDRAYCYSEYITLIDMVYSIRANGKPLALSHSKSTHDGRMIDAIPRVSLYSYPQENPVLMGVEKERWIQIHLQFLFKNKTLWPWDSSRTFLLSTDKGELFSQIKCNEGPINFSEIHSGDYSFQQEDSKNALEFLSLNQYRQFPYFTLKFLIKTTQGSLENLPSDRNLHVQLLWPLILINLRETDSPIFLNGLPDIREEDVQYLMTNGNSALFFVHGFNVSAGKLGKHLNSNLSWTECEASVFRDQYVIEKTINRIFPENYFKSSWEESYLLNGTGAFHWFLNMEYQFNKASAQFNLHQASDYQKYSRCVHVSWSGDPSTPWQYLEAQPRAFAAGVRLARVVNYLHHRGVRVQLVAHSLGAAVLYSALSTLAKENAPPVDLVILWQPAIPCNAFSATAHAPWGDAKALQACKQLVVLYSRNDNILGPIPSKQPEGLTQLQVNRAKSLSELLPAIIFQHLGFDSLYLSAQQLSVSPVALFHRVIQDALYQKWLREYPDRQAPIGGSAKDQRAWVQQGLYLPDLSLHLTYAKNQYRTYYACLYQRLVGLEGRINSELAEAHWGGGNAWESFRNRCLVEGIEALIGGLDWITLLLDELTVGYAESSLMMDRAVLIDVLLANETVQRLGCLLYMLHDVVNLPVPAMGYVGFSPQEAGRLMLEGKLAQVDQTKTLLAHSAMKIPSEALFQEIYREFLWNKMGLRVGTYQ